MNLEERLRERIRREGPISFYEWMKAALYDEREGYYCRRDRVRQGRQGDYRTAPEMSPLFGVAFANYFMKSYFDLGAPKAWTIVEIGSGTGDFAHDVLRSLQTNFPNIFDATQYIIDEVSADAQSQALSKVAPFKDRLQFRALSELREPLPHALIFSNELFDAFPVHRVIGRRRDVKELRVALSDAGKFEWAECKLDGPVAEYCDRIKLQLAEGQIYEVNLRAEQFLSLAAKSIREGVLITVDYGAERQELLSDPNRFSGTLRAFRRHQFVDDILSRPGEYDLTTTVDWTQIMEAGQRHGLEVLRFQRLNEFLMGEEALFEVMNAASRVADPAEQFKLNRDALELIKPDGMASFFQVLVQRKSSRD
ncbi:MAG TPA: SAM-dependent methyltransferase [Pyrinomonadaceae bacterium]|nr:SAM-dependent methyltransferase [Pyrinomonadaceae bacterium]